MCSSSGADRPVPIAGERLLHPLILLAIGTLLLNDHVLKGQWPGLLTGKLSDFAGLVFFPVFLQASWELACFVGGQFWSHSQRVLCACAVLTGAVFACVKLFPLGGQLYRYGLGALHGLPATVLDVIQGEAPRVVLARLTQDPSDVVALPALLVGLWLFRGGDS
jgi:hypothetical protein